MHCTALRETAFLSPSIAWNENVLSCDDVFAKINNKQNVSNEFYIEVSKLISFKANIFRQNCHNMAPYISKVQSFCHSFLNLR